MTLASTDPKNYALSLVYLVEGISNPSELSEDMGIGGHFELIAHLYDEVIPLAEKLWFESTGEEDSIVKLYEFYPILGPLLSEHIPVSKADIERVIKLAIANFTK